MGKLVFTLVYLNVLIDWIFAKKGCHLQWATKVLRHFVIFEYLRQISFLISTILPPPPFSMLNFLSLEFASFLSNIEKGGGGLALNINRIWNRISDMLQLALDSVNCLNYFCRPLSEVYLCELWRFPLHIQALTSLFSQKRLNAWFRLICY